jgi:hypothetical protein
MIVLGVLLSVAAYGLDPSRITEGWQRQVDQQARAEPRGGEQQGFAFFSESKEKIAYGAFGMVFLSLVIGAGCAFTIFLGYNYRGLLIAKKDLSGLHRLAKKVCSDCGLPLQPESLCIEDVPASVPVTGAFNTAHYWMLWPNAVVALGSLYFLSFMLDGLQNTIDVGALLLAVFVSWYPRVGAIFNRYMLIAKHVRPGRPESVVRECYRRALGRKKRRRKMVVDVLWIAYVVSLVLLAVACIGDVLLRFAGVWSYATLIVAGMLMVVVVLRCVQIRLECLVLGRRRSTIVN